MNTVPLDTPSNILYMLAIRGKAALGGRERVEPKEARDIHDAVVQFYRKPVEDDARAIDKHTVLFASALVNLADALAGHDTRMISIFGAVVGGLVFVIEADAWAEFNRTKSVRPTP